MPNSEIEIWCLTFIIRFNFQLKGPGQQQLENFWVDFNIGSKTMSAFVNDDASDVRFFFILMEEIFVRMKNYFIYKIFVHVNDDISPFYWILSPLYITAKPLHSTAKVPPHYWTSSTVPKDIPLHLPNNLYTPSRYPSALTEHPLHHCKCTEELLIVWKEFESFMKWTELNFHMTEYSP